MKDGDPPKRFCPFIHIVSKLKHQNKKKSRKKNPPRLSLPVGAEIIPVSRDNVPVRSPQNDPFDDNWSPPKDRIPKPSNLRQQKYSQSASPEKRMHSREHSPEPSSSLVQPKRVSIQFSFETFIDGRMKFGVTAMTNKSEKSLL